MSKISFLVGEYLDAAATQGENRNSLGCFRRNWSFRTDSRQKWRLVASRVFLQGRNKVDPLSAVAAFNDPFDSIATELITWTADAL
jgi:hypothetical protein